MDSVAYDAVPHYGVDDGNQSSAAAVKQESMEKDNRDSLGEVKKEPTPQDEAPVEEYTGRATRKRQLNSMAEASDLSDESADENYSKRPSKKRGGASAGRGRGRPRKSAGADVPTNQADPSRNPRIVDLAAEDGMGRQKSLKNIASDSQDDAQSTPAASAKGKGNNSSAKATRGRKARTPKTPAPKATPKGKNKTPKFKEEEEEEEEENEEEDDNGDVDFDDDVDDDDDEDFVPKKGKGGRAAKQPTPRARGKGKGKNKPKQESEEEEDEEDEDEEGEDEDGAVDASGDNADGNPNAVKTGQYLIEKSDMKHLENYPIWRMEGPNMLRKFEMIIQDGVVRHKSLYAYSSWAHSMLDLYEKIQVKHVSSQDGETVVEILPECTPKPPELSSLDLKYGGDELLPYFYIYIDALFRQAVDPSFLKRIKMENDAQYVGAINHIDAIIRERISNIENEVSMKEEFKGRVRNCPNMKSIRRQNWSQTDQATTNKSTEKGVRSVLMFGYGYDPFLMDEDKSKGVEVAQEVVVGSTMEQYLVSYHGLIHYKFSLLRRCQDKVKATNALEPMGDLNVLEKCLRDRSWALQAFEDLKNLLANENLA